MALNPVEGLERETASYKDRSSLYGALTTGWVNSTVPATASLSNTVPSYTTLGGQFLFAAVGGAETDYAIFGYKVPTNYSLFVDSVFISMFNYGAAVASTASIFEWAIGFNSTAASLATSDSTPVFGPRVVPIGCQSFLSGAAIGAQAPDIYRNLENPGIVFAGNYLHVIMRTPVGTATASQKLRGHVMIDGHLRYTGAAL